MSLGGNCARSSAPCIGAWPKQRLGLVFRVGHSVAEARSFDPVLICLSGSGGALGLHGAANVSSAFLLYNGRPELVPSCKVESLCRLKNRAEHPGVRFRCPHWDQFLDLALQATKLVSREQPTDIES